MDNQPTPTANDPQDDSRPAAGATDATGAPVSSVAPVPARRWPWFLLGVAIALLLLGAWYAWKKPFSVEEAAAPVVPPAVLDLQQGVNDSLQAEIDRYRAALAGDVCKEPLLPAGPDVYSPLVPVPGGQSAPQSSGSQSAAPSPSNPAEPGSTAAAEAQPAKAPSTVAELMEQATVFIVAPVKDGVSMGSGFFFAPNLVFTNYHVIGPGGSGKALVVNSFLREPLSGRVIASTNQNGRDYAVIEVAPQAGRQPAHLSFNPVAQRTDPVSAWGFPYLAVEEDPKYHALLEGKFDVAPEVIYTAGVISVIQAERVPPLIAHTAEVSQGSSGGPLVDAKGNVLGVNTEIHVDRESNRQLNVALASSDILAYLRQAGIIAGQK